MGIISLRGVTVITANAETKVVPEGFKTCSFVNTGSNDATLTQNGQSWIVPSGAVYNLNNTRDNDAWHAVSINAATTVVIATYY